ncbi:hypothetical protein [Blastomonas fulva]|uniref:hypothetical protein n=1 Tax=Blastomonas fulva TaxID=1550728 RepID=UPI003F7221E6
MIIPVLAACAMAGCTPQPAEMADNGAHSGAGCTANSRACIEAAAQSYIDGLVAHDGSKIPLAEDVRRTENGLNNARGPNEVRESFARTTMIEGARNVRFFTDVDKGETVAFFLLDIDLKEGEFGGGSSKTKSGDTEYEVAVTKPAGTYTVHEAERFRVVDGKIHDIEIIAHVEDGKGAGAGWPKERNAVIKKGDNQSNGKTDK